MSSSTDDTLINSILEFKSITGTDDEEALKWLNISDYNLLNAIDLYLHSNNESSINNSNKRDLYDEDGYRIKPDEVKRQRLLDDNNEILTIPPQLLDYIPPNINNLSSNYNKQKILSASVFGGPGNFVPKSSKDITLQELYSPPFSIMFKGDFYSARELAKTEKKWLLINIQDSSDFECHKLNRDVWKDEGLQDLISSCYVFIQYLNNSSEGTVYVNRYKVNSYPHIAIIDPRTGGLLWRRDKTFSLDWICDKLMDYMSNHFYEDTNNNNDIDKQSNDNDIIEILEDDDLEKAIKLSLDNNNSNNNNNIEINDIITSNSKKSDEKENEKLGFHNDNLPKYEDSLLVNNNMKSIRIQFRLTNKKLMKSFPNDCHLLTVASYVASQLDNNDNKKFEIYLTFPKKSFTELINNNIKTNKNEVTLLDIGIDKDTALIVETVN